MLDIDKSCSPLRLLLAQVVADCECHISIDAGCTKSHTVDSMATDHGVKIFAKKIKGFNYIPVDSLNLHTVTVS